MTKELKIFRETALPGVLQNDSIYFVTNPTNINLIECYLVNSTGLVRRLINEADIATMIADGISSSNNLTIVATIAARDLLTPEGNISVYVQDASADATVTSGGAYYLYNFATTTWIKTGESESMDVVLQWANITGKPTSSVANIDDAVTKRHTHTNKTEIDKIGQNGNGNLLYDGTLPHTGWESTNW